MVYNFRAVGRTEKSKSTDETTDPPAPRDLSQSALPSGSSSKHVTFLKEQLAWFSIMQSMRFGRSLRLESHSHSELVSEEADQHGREHKVDRVAAELNGELLLFRYGLRPQLLLGAQQ